MKFCPECGAAVSGGKFCTECGCKLQDEVTPGVSATTQPPVEIGFGAPDLSSFDALGVMADNCLAEDMARQEAEAFAAFVVEKHQNGKYAILALKDKSEMDIVVPNGVEAIGDGAFEGSEVLTVVLPEGLLKIGNRAFADCEDLEEINLPKSLRVIGDEAFAGCVNLDVDMPQDVRIGRNAFEGTAAEQQWEEHQRKCAAEQKAQEEAEQLDAKIAALENAARSLAWCKDVERAAAAAGSLFDEARAKSKKLTVLETLRSEVALVRAAADADKEIRTLAQAKKRDAKWREKVLELEKKIKNPVRPYLAEKESLSALLHQMEEDRKREEEEQKRKLEEQRIAEQNAKAEADKLDALIGKLDRQPHDSAWCADVESAAAAAERMSALARRMLKQYDLLTTYKKEAEQIRKAAKLDEQIRALAAAGKHDETWCKQVLAREKEITKAIRPLLTEQKTLSKLVPLAKEGQAKYEEQARIEREKRAEQAKKEAEAEAARLNESIDRLSEGVHDLAWCEQVDRIAAAVKRLPAAARNTVTSPEILEIYQEKAGLIREADLCDKKVRVLADDSARGGDWINEVLALDSKADDMLRTFMTEGERLSEMVDQIKKEQKRKETAQRWKKFRRNFGKTAGRVIPVLAPILAVAALVGGFVLICKSAFILGIVCEVVAAVLFVVTAFVHDESTLAFAGAAASLILVFVGLMLKWIMR